MLPCFFFHPSLYNSYSTLTSMKSSFSGMALPADMPVVSFLAYQNSNYQVSSTNTPRKLTSWYDTYSTSLKVC